MKKLIVLIAVLLAISSYAAHITVSINTNYIVGTSAPYNTLKGGDTLFIKAGNWSYIYIKDLTGNPTRPIVVTNLGGQVVINSGNYGIKLGGCRYIKLTGTGSSDKYGFYIQSAKGDGLSEDDLSSDIEACNIHISNTGIRGIVAKTDPGCNGYAVRNNFTQYNTIIHDNLIENTATEGMYIGSSFYSGETITCNGRKIDVLPSNLRDCHVYNNIVRHTGYDGIQLSCCVSGMSIDDNLIQYDSQKGVWEQATGIIIGGGSTGDCYNNYIENGKGGGIDFFGLGIPRMRIFNNVIVNAGLRYTAYGTQDGIYTNDNTMLPGAEVDIMFNTIITPLGCGIAFESKKATAGVIANNCIINPGNRGKYIVNGGSPSIVIKNNYTNATIANAKFADTTYKTQPGSPLIDAGWNDGKGITKDKFGNVRPQGTTYDIGVYEKPDH